MIAIVIAAVALLAGGLALELRRLRAFARALRRPGPPASLFLGL